MLSPVQVTQTEISTDALISSPGIKQQYWRGCLIISNPILNSVLSITPDIYSVPHTSFSHTGSDVSALGDWDGDGFDDFLIGADQTGLHETQNTLANPYGAVYALSGRDIIPWGVRGLDDAHLQITDLTTVSLETLSRVLEISMEMD